jgi:Tol biopolymer transport system component
MRVVNARSPVTVTSPQFSADGRTLLYVSQKQLRNLDRQGGELWAVDVASGRRQRLMSGFRIVTYAVSHDGRFVAASVRDGDGQPHIWVAPADGHAPPTRVAWPTPVMNAAFNPAGGLIILAREGASRSVYLTDLNGGNARKLIADTVTNVVGVSPSGKWLLVQAQVPGGEASNAALVAYPVDGGTPVTVFDTMWSMARWTRDGRTLYLRFARDDAAEVTVVSVPVTPENELPPLPPRGLKSSRDAARIAGAKLIGLGVAASPDVAAVAVSPDFSTLAIVRTAVHRNLYRVPLP